MAETSLIFTPLLGALGATFKGTAYMARYMAKVKPEPDEFPFEMPFHGLGNFLYVCSLYYYIAKVYPKKWETYKNFLWVASAIPTAGALALDERKGPAGIVKMSLYATGELVHFIAVGVIFYATLIEENAIMKSACKTYSSFQLPLLTLIGCSTHKLGRTPELNAIHSEDRDIFLPSFLKNLKLEAKENGYIEPQGILEEIKSVLLVQEGCANNILLQGESGSGKTATIEYLAWQIKEKKDPRFDNYQIYSLSIGDLKSNGGVVGGMERAVKLLKTFIKQKEAAGKKVVLFIDEIHQMINAGAAGFDSHGLDQILLPIITEPNLQIIGATTPSDFHHFERKEAFLNRFTGLEMPPMEQELKKQIIEDLIKQHKLPDEFANDQIFQTGIPRDIRQILALTAARINCVGCQPEEAFNWAKSKATKTKKDLPSFIKDLTEEAKEKVYVEPEGLVSEIETILLAQDGSANNVLLFGESGSGKTAAVEYLAWKIKQGQSGDFKGYKIYSLNARDLTAQGRGLLGDFERGIKNLERFIDVQIQRGRKVILFIDEIHQLIGGGATYNSPHGLDQHLLTLLTIPHLRVIGATTPSDFQYFYGKDAFINRFSTLEVHSLSEKIKEQIIIELLRKHGLDESLSKNEVFQGVVPRGLHQILALAGSKVKRDKCSGVEALRWATGVAQRKKRILSRRS